MTTTAAAAVDATYILCISFFVCVCASFVHVLDADADSISIDKMSHFMIEF